MKIKEICATLQPSKIGTKKLQAEQLTLSEFFGTWYEIKIATKAIHNPFVALILEQITSREQNLLNNDVLLSAVYMDPRYKILLEKTQIERAKNHLKHVWLKMLSIQNCDENLNLNDRNSLSTSSGTDSTCDELENLFKLKERQHNTNSYLLSSKKQDSYLQLRQLEAELETYDIEQKRISRKTNVLQFWKEKRKYQSELYKLAIVVLSVPATQVSVERLFSGLKYISSPLRTNINDKILEDQLLVRTNRIFSCKDETYVMCYVLFSLLLYIKILFLIY